MSFSGSVSITDANNKETINLAGGTATAGSGGVIRLGGNTGEGRLFIFPKTTKPFLNPITEATVRLNSDANMLLGGNGASGDLIILPSTAMNTASYVSKATVHINSGGNIYLGGNGQDGDLVIFPSSSTNINDLNQATILLDGAGNLTIKDGKGIDIFHIDGGGAAMRIGPHGGITDKGGTFIVRSKGGSETIRLDGDTGDVILQNADCAEEFDISDCINPMPIEPGTVMVMDSDGKLSQSSRPYDKRVAGVVSGAGGFKPGIILDRKISENQRIPLAIIGKVFCKADAIECAIEAGDLLTSSTNPGYAMKVTEWSRAFGAVIGKALSSMTTGRGLIPILVSLQ
jgi:hypothetical protein